LTVTTRAIDLLAAAPPAERGFDLVCVVDFFDADLWSRLGDLLAAGGSLVARSFTRDWPGDRPPARYRLAPGALAAGLPGLTSVWHEEAGGRSGLLARRPE
jgi:hypothetical protein